MLVKGVPVVNKACILSKNAIGYDTNVWRKLSVIILQAQRVLRTVIHLLLVEIICDNTETIISQQQMLRNWCHHIL